MTTIKNVAVLGATGNVGPAITSALASSGFTVTVLTRSAQPPSNLPPNVTVRTVDYTSRDSLSSALAGQDAVISALAGAAVPLQKQVIDVAAEVGVKRFVPSEFGINTRKARGSAIGKILGGKIEVVDYLKEKEGSGLTWTGVATGLFFDWGLERTGLGVINLKERTSTVVDSGNERFQTSTLAQVGRAVVHVLQHPDETANKYISTSSFNVSQNEIISAVEDLTGTKFPVTARQSSADLQKSGEEKLAKGDWTAFFDLLRAWNNGDGRGNALSEEESGNKLIGLEGEDLKTVLREWLRKEGVLKA